jgi:hypothetical protein
MRENAEPFLFRSSLHVKFLLERQELRRENRTTSQETGWRRQSTPRHGPLNAPKNALRNPARLPLSFLDLLAPPSFFNPFQHQFTLHFVISDLCSDS